MSRLRLITIVGLLAIPGAAIAQPGSPPPPPPPTGYYETPNPRVGWELGVGLEVGEINCTSEDARCDGVTEAGGINLNAAFMFNPQLGIAGEIWAMAHTEDAWTFTHVVSTIGVKWRPAPALTLYAGLGHAHASLESDVFNVVVDSGDAPAFALAAAFDIVRSRNWAIDLHAKLGVGFYGDDDDDGEADIVGRNVGVGVGFTWF
jgi:hypothetical protein